MTLGRHGAGLWSRRPDAATASVRGQHDQLPDPRPRQPGHTAPEPGDLNLAVIEPVVERAKLEAMLRGLRQIHQRAHRSVRAQQRIGQLELRVRPRAKAGVELVAEPAQPGDRLDSAILTLQAVHRDLRSIMVSRGENTIFRGTPHVPATRARSRSRGLRGLARPGTGARLVRTVVAPARCPRPSRSSIRWRRPPGGRGRPARPGCVGSPRSGSLGPSAAPAPTRVVRRADGLVVVGVGPAAGDELGVPAQQGPR